MITAITSPLLLALAVVLFYLQVAGHDFVNWDDNLFVYQEPFVQQGLTAASWHWAWTMPEQAFFTPLSRLSSLVEVSLFGMNPGAMHLVNVLFHALNVALLFVILRNLTGQPGAAWLVAVLSAVHPQHVEAVAWISERKELMSFFFGMLAIHGYHVALRDRSRPAFLASVACHLLSLLVKPLWVTLPLLLLLLDHWPLQRPWQGRLVVEKWPYWLLSLLFSLLTLASFSSQENLTTLQQVSLEQRLTHLVVAYGLYLEKALLPVGLSPFYPHVGDDLPMGRVWLAAALLLSFSLLAWWQRVKRPALAVGWLWFLGTFIPVSGLVNGGQVVALADRWSYFPHVGLWIALAWGGLPRPPLSPWLKGGLLLWVAVLGWLAWQQTALWKNSETLWRGTLQVLPVEHSEHVHFLLGLHYKDRGRLPEASAQLEESYRIQPQDPFLVVALAGLYEQQGRGGEARQLRRQLLTLPPLAADALLGTGLDLFKSGQQQEARQFFAKALTSQGRGAAWAREEARFFMGLSFWLTGDGQAATPYWRDYFQVVPLLRERRCASTRRLFLTAPFQAHGAAAAAVETLCLTPGARP